MKFTLAVITLTILLLRLTPNAWANPLPSSDNDPETSDATGEQKQTAESSAQAAATADTQAELDTSFTDLLATTREMRDKMPSSILQVNTMVKRREALQRANSALNTYETNARNLQARIVQVREKMDTNIENGEAEVIGNWQAWEKRQLAIVTRSTRNNDEVVAEANTETTAFIERYTEYLESCSDELTAQLETYESDVKEALDEHIQHVEWVGEEVDNCVAERNKPVQTCERYINASVKELTSASSDLQALNQRGVKLTTINYQKTTCVVQTIRAFETERLKIEKNLKVLIDNA